MYGEYYVLLSPGPKIVNLSFTSDVGVRSTIRTRDVPDGPRLPRNYSQQVRASVRRTYPCIISYCNTIFSLNSASRFNDNAVESTWPNRGRTSSFGSAYLQVWSHGRTIRARWDSASSLNMGFCLSFFFARSTDNRFSSRFRVNSNKSRHSTFGFYVSKSAISRESHKNNVCAT